MIDVMRGFAILLVVVYHAFPEVFKSGYVGVDVFFVVSGFVIFRSIKDREFPLIGPWIKGFYYRRLFRIVPPLSIALIVGGVFSALFIPLSGISKDVLKTGLSAILGFSNQIISEHQGGYFALNSHLNLFHHTWSLAVEEQFYLLTPTLLMLASRKYSWKTAESLLFAGVFLSFYYLTTLWIFNKSAYLSSFARVWELFAGMILCSILTGDTSVSQIIFLKIRLKYHRLLVWLMRACFLVLVLLSIVSLEKYFPFPLAIVPVLCASVLLFGSCCIDVDDIIPVIWVSRLLVHLGIISYSWYLYHYIFIVLASWTVGLDGYLTTIAFVLLSYIFSLGSYFFLEKPLIGYAKTSAGKPMWWIPFAFMTAAAISLSALFYWSRTITLSVTGKNRIDWYQPKVSNKVLYRGAEDSLFSGRKLFVFGDSHAYAYRGLFSELLAQGVSFYLDERGGRGFSLIRPLEENALNEFEEFYSVVKSNSKPQDLVFLPSLKTPRLCDYWYSREISDFQNQICYTNLAAHDLALKEIVRVIQKLEDAGLIVMIDGPKPVLPSPPFRISDWFNRMNPIGRNGVSIQGVDLAKCRNEVNLAIEEIRRRCPQLLVFEPYEILCPNGDCNAFDGGRPVFFDGDHLSGYGARKCLPLFTKSLEQIWIAGDH